MKKIYALQSTANANYQKAIARLEKNLRSGRFATYSKQRKQQIWNRLCRYAQQLGIKVKASLAAACIAAGLTFAGSADAQTFVLRTDAANPVNGKIAGSYVVPVFVDIDKDGDADAFVGAHDGTIKYYKNTGTAAAAVFTEQTGPANPFNGVDVGLYAAPAFVDIDNDGDLDAFIGEAYGTIVYYKNTGTATAPVFTLITGAANPFNGVQPDYFVAPTFVDIDKDGDMDAFLGTYYGDILYYKNTGTASAPVFTAQTGSANPFDGLFVNYYSNPAFVDVDKDGDFDAFVGEGYGDLIYFKNTGTATAPVFVQQTDADNPLAEVLVEYFSTPTFVDIDGDGDMDAFIGGGDGAITYFENTSVLPLKLLNFSGSRQAGFNQLQWLTAAEFNTKLFEVEQSTDGINFKKIATVAAAGSSDNIYYIKDDGTYNGKVYYRLKMVDIDGRFTYSSIIWINAEATRELTIYPNPVRDRLNIFVGSDRLLKTNADIYDAGGRLQRRILINSNQVQVNTGTLPKGMYMIRFADGSAKNFIKE